MVNWIDNYPEPGDGGERQLGFRRDGELWKLDPRTWVDVDEPPPFAAQHLRDYLAWVTRLERGAARVEAGQLKTFDAIGNASDDPAE